MLLIRGFDQEQYARQIKGGTIGFCDLLTTLLYHEKNGYKLSDYYEECLIQAIDQSSMEGIRFDGLPRQTREQLKLIFDSFVPYFYLSYFHVFNEHSLEWLEKNFKEDAHFIFAVPKLQQLEGMDEMMYGPHMIGSRMVYLPPEGQARTAKRLIQKSGIVALQQEELDASAPYGGAPMDAAMYMTNMMAVICLEALARRCSGDYNADENEFRIIYKIPTPYRREIGSFRARSPGCSMCPWTERATGAK